MLHSPSMHAHNDSIALGQFIYTDERWAQALLMLGQQIGEHSMQAEWHVLAVEGISGREY